MHVLGDNKLLGVQSLKRVGNWRSEKKVIQRRKRKNNGVVLQLGEIERRKPCHNQALLVKRVRL